MEELMKRLGDNFIKLELERVPEKTYVLVYIAKGKLKMETDRDPIVCLKKAVRDCGE